MCRSSTCLRKEEWERRNRKGPKFLVVFVWFLIFKKNVRIWLLSRPLDCIKLFHFLIRKCLMFFSWIVGWEYLTIASVILLLLKSTVLVTSCFVLEHWGILSAQRLGSVRPGRPQKGKSWAGGACWDCCWSSQKRRDIKDYWTQSLGIRIVHLGGAFPLLTSDSDQIWQTWGRGSLSASQGFMELLDFIPHSWISLVCFNTLASLLKSSLGKRSSTMFFSLEERFGHIFMKTGYRK